MDPITAMAAFFGQIVKQITEGGTPVVYGAWSAARPGLHLFVHQFSDPRYRNASVNSCHLGVVRLIKDGDWA